MALDPDTLNQLGAGASGSAVAAWLARATGWNLVGMFLAGLSAAHFTAPAIASIFNLTAHNSAVGFVVGFLAIMVLRKFLAVIEGIPAESIGGVLLQKLRKVLGVGNDSSN
jgi:ABC-type transport system involved in cytochrome bd biosynthesis fused ATPase/permease subunit